MAKYGKQPGSVLVNLALAAIAPDRKYPYLLITGPKGHNCNKLGIPSTDDISEMEEVLDATTNFITGVTPKVLAGTFTYKCDRLNYYYVKDTIGIRDALGRMYARSYSGYNYTIRMKRDQDWISYRTFLYPDSATLRWMNYSKAVAALIEKGDSLTKERDIRFDVYFRTDTDRVAFADEVKNKGFKTDELVVSESAAAPFELIASKRGLVKMEVIFDSEDIVAEAVKRYHGIYNGWSAPLKNEPKK
jgi:hypothetical protein